MTQGPQQHLFVLGIEARLDEQLVAAGLDAQIDHRLGRVNPPGRAIVGHRRIGWQSVPVDPDPFEVRRPGLGTDALSTVP